MPELVAHDTTDANLKPSPPCPHGGEGWVRGKSVGLEQGTVEVRGLNRARLLDLGGKVISLEAIRTGAQRRPLTPTLSPNDEAVLGERE